ncbi:MAG: 2,3-bisphosphoglycerate-independent phosphoglycerate mutase [Pyrinomonadaceae bacterium]
METQSAEASRPVTLVILDGWGYAPRTEGNAIAVAHTPWYDEICRKYPMTTLSASGTSVGQPDSAPGSSEVGHLNLGTGRVARIEVERIKAAVKSGEFAENKVFERAFIKAKSDGSSVHLIGLLSDGGVHSSTDNLFAILRLAKQYNLDKVYVHGILDGVDVSPRTADIYVEALEIKLADIGLGEIATLCGRFFAMDSDERWERTARAFTMLVHAEGERGRDAVTSVRNSFLRGISDEFIAPVVIEDSSGAPVGVVSDGDLVIFFNHRPETMRQLARSLCVPESAGVAKPGVEAVCLTEYDAAFNLPVAFRQEPEKNALIPFLDRHRMRHLKITESARVAHMTYFFDGGADAETYEGDGMISLPTTSEHRPESQSFKITDNFRRSLAEPDPGLVIVNLPAADIAGATGYLSRTIDAIQYIDTCVGALAQKMSERGGALLLTSAHGNCESMVQMESGEPNPHNTANPVPFHYIDDAANGTRLRDGGSLQDVAPTILGLLGFEPPPEMTGTDLRAL